MPGMSALRAVAAPLDLDELSQRFTSVEAPALIRWAVQQFGSGLILSTSFGAQSALMLHLVSEVAPELPVVFIDTGYLFPETYRFAEELKQRLKLNLKVYGPVMTPARQEALYGKQWEEGDDGIQAYLQRNKVEPMQRALKELGATAWLAGLRQKQTSHRAQLRPVEQQNGRYKVHPILSWTDEEVTAYLERHDLPLHPLYEQGYRSIGDVHSTIPTTADQDPREGRILGQKRECGLHLPLTPEQGLSLRSSGL
jgi:phosphoadenosine phosphosulfate reductase